MFIRLLTGRRARERSHGHAVRLLRSLPGRFSRSRSGNVALIFALAAVPLLGMIGSAVDYTRASVQQARLQAASDAAIIAGVVAAKTDIDKGNGEAAALRNAKSAAEAYFRSNYQNSAASFTATFTMSGLSISGTATATHQNPTTFMTLFGISSTPIGARSQSKAATEPYLNIYLLIDISASMLLPATADGIAQMTRGTGCALACHDKANGNDTYGWALRNNILMRYQVVNQGIDNLVSYIRSKQTLSGKVRIELWSFDHDMRRLVSLTSDLTRITRNFPAPALASSDESAATRFDDLISTFVSAVGTSGSGLSQQDAKKLVMIATDGVNDPTRAWTSNVALRSQVRAFSTTFCDTLKQRGNTVAIINTPYLPMPWDWGYNATLGQPGTRGGTTRVDDIPIVLRRCAGSYFTVASDVEAIRSSFVSLFTAATPIRLSQ